MSDDHASHTTKLLQAIDALECIQSEIKQQVLKFVAVPPPAATPLQNTCDFNKLINRLDAIINKNGTVKNEDPLPTSEGST